MVERRLGEKVIRLVRGDITEADTDAFVYDITSDCKLGSGYGGAIAARGGRSVQDELSAIGSCPTGDAVVTTAGQLPSKYIIHVNGPKFLERDTEQKLRSAVAAALCRAEEKGLASLAFPPLGTGLYQVPLDLCTRVMVETVEAHLLRSSKLAEVRLVAGDAREHAPFAAALYGRA